MGHTPGPVRIAVTICDCSDVVHAGGEPNRLTSVIELTEAQVPRILRDHLKYNADQGARAEKYGGSGYTYQSATLSLVEDSQP